MPKTLKKKKIKKATKATTKATKATKTTKARKLRTSTVMPTELAGHTSWLGEIISWDFASNDIPKDDYDKAIAQLAADIEMEIAVPKVRMTTIVSRSKKDMAEGNTLLRRIKGSGNLADEDAELLYQLTDEEHNEAQRKIEYKPKACIEIDRDTGDVVCDDPVVREATKRSVLHNMTHRKGRDGSKIIRAVCEEHADLCSINKSKGVGYFVPIRHEGVVDAIEKFTVACGGEISRFPIPAGEKSERSVCEAVSRHLDGLIKKLEDECSKWEGGKTRDSTTEASIERFQELAAKAEAYSVYLGDKQRDMKNKLKAARAHIAKEVLRVHQESASKEKEKSKGG